MKNGPQNNLIVKENNDSLSENVRVDDDIFIYIKPKFENVANFTLNITTYNISLGFDSAAKEHYLIIDKWSILNATSPTFSAAAINQSQTAGKASSDASGPSSILVEVFAIVTAVMGADSSGVLMSFS